MESEAPVDSPESRFLAPTRQVIGTEMSDLAATEYSSLRDYLLADKAEATRKAYTSDFRAFTTWCHARGDCPLPADPRNVALYLAWLADRGKKISTIQRHFAAIRYTHKIKGLEPPTNVEGVRAVVRGIRRTLGTAVTQKAPATADAMEAMLAETPDSITGKRDRALLLVGFAAAMRRSELVALDVADLERSPEGVRIHIRRSKTDQEGAGHIVAVPRGTKLKPTKALDEWLEASGITEGPVFRSIRKGGAVQGERLTAQSVALIVKRYAEKAGMDAEIFSGHSLRSGFVTSALENGADLLKVMDVTRHREMKSLKTYDRRVKAFRNHAGRGFL